MIVEVPYGAAGLSLTVSVFPDGSDTASASGVAMHEATNRTGYYYSNNIAAPDGLHLVQVHLASGPLVWEGFVVFSNVVARAVAQESMGDALLYAPGSAAPSFPTGANYATANDLYMAFGKDNIRIWADVNNNGVQADVDARIAWALQAADDHFNSRLSSSPYEFPITGTIPPELTRMAAYYAAMILSESRAITDTEEDKGDLKWVVKRIETFINGVRFGSIKLTGVTPRILTTDIPFVVNDVPQLHEFNRRHCTYPETR